MTWFVHSEDRILGPFSKEKILDDLQNGNIPYTCHIWAKGQVEWIPIADWADNVASYTLSQENQTSAQLWKIRAAGEVSESLTMDGAIAILKNHENLKQVSISPQDDETWVPIYSSYMFMEALNLSRRSCLRAPLMGLAKITRKTSRFSYVVKTATVGEGGIGVYGLGSSFDIGTQIQLKVESEDLSAPLNVTGTVVYSTDRGFVGISFETLSAESKAIVLDYIKRFGDVEANGIKSAA